MFCLDCYHYGAMLGKEFPVNSFGPASIEELENLYSRMNHNFDRTEIVQVTKGMCPQPPEYWPGVPRPR